MPNQPPKVVRLDQLEAIPGPGTLTWRPVRLTLDVRAFGCNAYTAGAAGDDVVEPHTEDPELAHQELYFVAAGRAMFLRLHPASPSLNYNLACLEAVEGRRDEALAALGIAIGLNPDVAEWAQGDAELDSLRNDPVFRSLVDK